MLVPISSFLKSPLSGEIIALEITITRGIKFQIVGLPPSYSSAIQQRVYTVLKSHGFRWPGMRITVNVPRKSSYNAPDFDSLDLPIALGILAASNQRSFANLTNYVFSGKFQLDGTVEPYIDPFNLTQSASSNGIQGAVFHVDPHYLNYPKPNPAFDLVNVKNLGEVLAFLSEGARPLTTAAIGLPLNTSLSERWGCFSEVSGQRPLKRALEIAAAGGHHLLVEGPPGQGKTMLCSRFGSILPPLDPAFRPLNHALRWHMGIGKTFEENIERGFERIPVNLKFFEFYGPGNEFESLLSQLQNPKNEVVLQKLPKGWLSKLIGGAFFLDELTRLPEVFRNFLLDHLDVHHIQCIAALNPCACGMHGHRERPCTCSSTSFDRYQRKLPTPFRERFDLRINCQPEAWEGVLKEETSAVVRLRTTAAWERQINRQGKQNALLSYQELLSIMAFTKSQLDWLHRKFVLMKSSPREQLNGLRVALTLADLANEEPALCHVQQVFDEQVEGAEGGSPKPLEKRVVKIGTIIARG